MTGMRVGEIAALTWSKITDEYILVDQSEKYNRKTKEYYISITKNCMERQFPLTPEIKDLLERIKKAEARSGVDSLFSVLHLSALIFNTGRSHRSGLYPMRI